MTTSGLDILKGFSSAELQNTQWYPPEFFSGCDVDLAFTRQGGPGDDPAIVKGYVDDDILTMSFAVRQLKEPIYNYNDYLFSRTARGNILVIGNIALAYTFKRKIIETLEVAYNGSLERGDFTGSVPESASNYKNLTMEQRIAKLLTLGASADTLTDSELTNETGIGIVEGRDEELATAIDYFGDTDLSIIINYGSREGASPNETLDAYNAMKLPPIGMAKKVERIHNVELNFVKKVIQPTGAPVAEIYNFTGRAVT